MTQIDPDRRQRDPKTYAVIGAAMEVHRSLGHGFLERVYHEALAIELIKRRVPHVSEHALPLSYKGQALATGYRADFVCYGCVLVQLKALCSLTSDHESQVINYLKASKIHTGLLLNFGAPSLEFRRLVL